MRPVGAGAVLGWAVCHTPPAGQWHLGCRHFVATHAAINLNGEVPIDMKYCRIAFDVPYVIPLFLPDDIPSFAVMHSLPICRIEGNAFVPRYIVYMMTYYSAEPKTLWTRRWSDPGEARNADVDSDYRAVTMWPAAGQGEHRGEIWNLRLWVEAKRLHWFDFSKPDLPLKSGPPEEYPYADIRGYRHSLRFRNGRLLNS